MESEIHNILEVLVTGALSLLSLVITGLLTLGSQSIKQWLDSKAHAAAFSCATTKLETLTKGAVMEIEQTVVRKLKADEKWTPETARFARDSALEIVKRQLGQKGLAELQGCLGLALKDIEGLIRTKIETTVQSSGSGSGPVVDLGE